MRKNKKNNNKVIDWPKRDDIKKVQISTTIYKRQFITLKKLMELGVFDSRAEIIRVAIDFWLQQKYTEALLREESVNEIVSKIIGVA